MEREQKVTTGWNLVNSYACLPKEMYSNLLPTPVKAPKLVLCNLTLAQELGLNQAWLMSPEGVQELSGNRIPEGAKPLAQAYAGHQFGHFTMLGDGRAILLGEQLTQDGRRVDIQLKGPGRTPFSRGGDGRAALGPMLREYIISEAMHGLGIPTTRSLAVVATGEMVYRETALPGAILTRVAASHVRVGTFQYAAAAEKQELLNALLDFTLSRHYPGFEEVPNKAQYLLQEVVKRQASLIAKWQLVGFIHGVMNTDNMALSGESIDFGPCAYMDIYDEETVFSSIDNNGRYAYGNQPKMAAWNLARFAETLLTLIHEDPSKAVEIAQQEITRFHELYQENWLAGMRAKLGLHNQEDSDLGLIQELLTLMKQHKADYTNTFRSLTLEEIKGMEMFKSKDFETWYRQWQLRLKRQPDSSVSPQQLMKNSNPSVIPRNHRVEEALTAAVEEEDSEKLNRLLIVLSNPYSYSKDQEEFTTLPEVLQQKYQTFCGT